MAITLKNWLGDITELKVDAIVNAANKSLLGGGGVDGAIHRAAGPDLLRATKKLGGAATGEAKMTKAYHLPADFVIHAVGPVYKDGNSHEAELLASAYRNSLGLAEEKELKSIAFPAISTGIYGYPLKNASKIAVDTIKKEFSKLKSIEKIIFVSYDEQTFEIYEKLIDDYDKERKVK